MSFDFVYSDFFPAEFFFYIVEFMWVCITVPLKPFLKYSKSIFKNFPEFFKYGNEILEHVCMFSIKREEFPWPALLGG